MTNFGQKIGRALRKFGSKASSAISSGYGKFEKVHDVVSAVKPLGELSYSVGAQMRGTDADTINRNLENFNQKYNTASEFRNRVEYMKYMREYPQEKVPYPYQSSNY